MLIYTITFLNFSNKFNSSLLHETDSSSVFVNSMVKFLNAKRREIFITKIPVERTQFLTERFTYCRISTEKKKQNFSKFCHLHQSNMIESIHIYVIMGQK